MTADQDPRPDTGLPGFEEIYARAGQDLGAIPWAALAPNPALVGWLDQQPPAGDHALVIGCGLGDDAEEAGRRGSQVTAFDLSPTAIRHCQRRVSRPWPVSRGELRGFIQAGLREAEFADQPPAGTHSRFFTAVYAWPGTAELPVGRETT